MAGITKARAAYDNRVKDSTATLSASTYATKFPVSYVANTFRQMRWRSTGCASEWIQVTEASAFDVSCIIAEDTNLSTDATVRLEGSNDAFATTGDELLIKLQNGSRFIEFGEMFRYSSFRVYFEDPTNTDGYIQIGLLFLGTYIQADRNYTDQIKFGAEDLSVKQPTPGGVVHVQVYPQREVVPVPFYAIEEAQRLLFKALHEAVGTHTPFWVALDYDNYPDEQTLYVTFVSLPEFEFKPPWYYNTTWLLREEV